MTVDAETQRLAREAATYLRSAMDQLDAAYQDLIKHGLLTPLEPREDCPNCGGRGYTGRHTHDPQQSTADDCEWCDGVGWVPPPEPPS
jgi:hypothetical protein